MIIMQVVPPENHRRKIWGRKVARPLKDSARLMLEQILPKIRFTIEPNQEIVFNFPDTLKEIWLEIGFGSGEHLAAQLAAHPHIGMIGCEPFLTGVAALLNKVPLLQQSRLRVATDDARLLLESLPNACVDRIFILFPDPWHKKRHNKRRIVREDTILQASRALKVGGILRLATDIEEYGQWMQDIMVQFPYFQLHLGTRKNIYERPTDWPTVTRYEQKGIDAGRTPLYLDYIHKPPL